MLAVLWGQMSSSTMEPSLGCAAGCDPLPFFASKFPSVPVGCQVTSPRQRPKGLPKAQIKSFSKAFLFFFFVFFNWTLFFFPSRKRHFALGSKPEKFCVDSVWILIPTCGSGRICVLAVAVRQCGFVFQPLLLLVTAVCLQLPVSMHAPILAPPPLALSKQMDFMPLP